MVKRIRVNCGSELISVSLSVIWNENPSTSTTKVRLRKNTQSDAYLFCTFLQVYFAILKLLVLIVVDMCVCLLSYFNNLYYCELN